MKKNILICMLLSILALISCAKNESKKSNETAALTETPIKVDCYRSIYEADTIDLKINTLKNGKISGKMEMKLEKMPIKKGEISGEFRGDTLFADYSFIQGTNDKVVFKNPMAFLKNDKEFVLGNGKIVTYLGASYFEKGEPIDFENVKYKFNLTNCTEK